VPKATRIARISVGTAHKPPINFGLSVHLRDVQNTLHRLVLAIQIAANLGKSANKS
jgi:hypothetical protein